jgi:hypothetical protein
MMPKKYAWPLAIVGWVGVVLGFVALIGTWLRA